MPSWSLPPMMASGKPFAFDVRLQQRLGGYKASIAATQHFELCIVATPASSWRIPFTRSVMAGHVNSGVEKQDAARPEFDEVASQGADRLSGRPVGWHRCRRRPAADVPGTTRSDNEDAARMLEDLAPLRVATRKHNAKCIRSLVADQSASTKIPDRQALQDKPVTVLVEVVAETRRRPG